MNFISNRLKTISSLIKPFTNIADIGCDHGYLIISSFLNNHIKFAQAIDNKEGPLLSAKKNIENYDFYDKVIFTLSDGIKDLDVRVEVLVIAGLGGLTITNILSAKPANLRNIKRIIVQPNRNIYEVRKWATENKWEIVNEIIIEENDIFYEILVLERAKEFILYSEKELIFGPILIQKRDEVFIKKWDEISKNNERLINNKDLNLERSNDLKMQIALIKEIIHENKECY